MKKKHIKHELNNTIFDLHFHEKRIYTDDSDTVWSSIVDDAHNYERKRNEFPHDQKYKSPFKQFDRPDIIYENCDFIMGIECFQFDASKKTKKGSAQKKSEVLIDNKQNYEFKQIKDTASGHIVFKDQVNADFSIENYISSLMATYKEHSKQISEYKNNLVRLYPNKEIYITFFIEDVTALGNYIKSPKGVEALIPFRLIEFMDEMSLTPELDYIVVKYKYDFYVPSLIIVKNDYFLRTYGNATKEQCSYIQYTYSRESHIHLSPQKGTLTDFPL